MSILNTELYEFLKDNENGLYMKEKTKEVIAFVHISFYKLHRFTKIIGYNYLSEGGAEWVLQEDNVCIELNDIIEYLGDSLLDYKDCFNTNDWEYYKEYIEKMYED